MLEDEVRASESEVSTRRAPPTWKDSRVATVNPPRGMRDILPADKARRESVLAVIRERYRAHGFDEIETPAPWRSTRACTPASAATTRSSRTTCCAAGPGCLSAIRDAAADACRARRSRVCATT